MSELEDRGDKKFELIRNQVKFISSNFDTVQIFASKYDPDSGDTAYFCDGRGNWCARYGQVRAWVLKEEGQMAEEGARKMQGED